MGRRTKLQGSRQSCLRLPFPPFLGARGWSALPATPLESSPALGHPHQTVEPSRECDVARRLAPEGSRPTGDLRTADFPATSATCWAQLLRVPPFASNRPD